VETPEASPPEKPVVYNGITYYGRGKVLDNSYPWSPDESSVSIEYPKEKSFEADSFFTMKGTVTNSHVNDIALISIRRGELERAYWVQGNFEQRIWLPFGPGEYEIVFHRINEIMKNFIPTVTFLPGLQFSLRVL